MRQETFTPSDDLSWRDVNDEMVVLNLKSGEYYTFNDVGRVAWLALADGKSVDEIVDAIVEEYDVQRDAAASDVRHFIDGLVQNRVVEKRERVKGRPQNGT